jgi:putative membrane protein
MNGNKKIAKKIVAGSMAVMMAAGLAGTYEYHNNVMQVQAAEQKDKDTQELKETAENVLADHATDSEMGPILEAIKPYIVSEDPK